MIGEHKIVVSSKRIKFEFTVRRNITILRGNSATGKTTLVEMIKNYSDNGLDSGVTVVCDKKCEVLSGSKWKTTLSDIADAIVFIDEGNKFVGTPEFAESIRNSDNYYVIVSREDFESLPYSMHEIYGLRESGKYSSIKQTYNESYWLYEGKTTDAIVKPDLIITEDSKTGYQFFSSLGIACESAGGKSNIVEKIVDRGCGLTLIIGDGAALGPDIDAIIQAIRANSNYALYTPESFEWLLLRSGIFSGTVATSHEIKKILERPSDYIDSSKYFSWEQFFTHYLVKITNDMERRHEMIGYRYPSSKKKLPKAYLRKQTVDKILSSIPKIKFN